VSADPTTVAAAGSRVFVGSGTQQTLRVVSPTTSQPLALGTDPRNLLAVGTGVWVAGSRPGRVVSVS
jgi:hypothetical protein